MVSLYGCSVRCVRTCAYSAYICWDIFCNQIDGQSQHEWNYTYTSMCACRDSGPINSNERFRIYGELIFWINHIHKCIYIYFMIRTPIQWLIAHSSDHSIIKFYLLTDYSLIYLFYRAARIESGRRAGIRHSCHLETDLLPFSNNFIVYIDNTSTWDLRRYDGETISGTFHINILCRL